MKLSSTLFTLVLALFIVSSAFAQANQQEENYPPHPDSQEQPGVPKGEVLKFTFENSKVFPGTGREYWVYVPAQYTPDKPACVYVNQDGQKDLQWKANIVFDNLIDKTYIAVKIGVLVDN